MTIVFFVGVAITIVGLVGILWFIRRARKLREREGDNEAVHAEFRNLVILNVAALFLAFLGLAVAVVGLVLAS